MATIYLHALTKGSDSGVRNMVFPIDDGAELTALYLAYTAGDRRFVVASSGVALSLEDISAFTLATVAEWDAWKVLWNKPLVASTDGRVQQRIRMFGIEAPTAPTNVYQVPDDVYGARATHVFVTNDNNLARTFTLELVPSGGVIGSGLKVFHDFGLAKDENVGMQGDAFMEPGDFWALDASGTGVALVLSGWEILA